MYCLLYVKYISIKLLKILKIILKKEVLFKSEVRTGKIIPWFSKCGPWICSISITWKLVRNTNSQPHPRTAESETLGVGLSNLGFFFRYTFCCCWFLFCFLFFN